MSPARPCLSSENEGARVLHCEPRQEGGSVAGGERREGREGARTRGHHKLRLLSDGWRAVPFQNRALAADGLTMHGQNT